MEKAYAWERNKNILTDKPRRAMVGFYTCEEEQTIWWICWSDYTIFQMLPLC